MRGSKANEALEKWYADPQITDPLFMRLNPVEMRLLQLTSAELYQHPQLQDGGLIFTIKMMLKAKRLARDIIEERQPGAKALVLNLGDTYIAVEARWTGNDYRNPPCRWKEIDGGFDRTYQVIRCHEDECQRQNVNDYPIGRTAICWKESVLAKNIYAYLRAGYRVDESPPNFVARLFRTSAPMTVIV